jgi:hypothetical protein
LLLGNGDCFGGAVAAFAGLTRLQRGCGGLKRFSLLAQLGLLERSECGPLDRAVIAERGGVGGDCEPAHVVAGENGVVDGGTSDDQIA